MSKIPRTVAATILATTTLGLTGAVGGLAPTAAASAHTTSPRTATSRTTCDGMAPVTELSSVTYADQLVRAWGRGDHPATSCYATAAVADQLFDQADPGGVHWRRVAVDGTAGTIYVTYHDDARGGTLTVGVQDLGLRGRGGWHAAYTARFRGEPASLGPLAWGDELIRAWGRGDRSAASYYATPGVVQTLFGYANPGGGHWYRESWQGATQSTFITYRDSRSGHEVQIAVADWMLQRGDTQAAYSATFLR